MWGALLPMGIGAGIGLLTGGAKGAVKGAVTGGVAGGASKLMPAANGLLPAKASAVGDFMKPTLGEVGGANLYSSGIAPAIPNAAAAAPLMTSTAAAQGGMSLMPGEWDWMKNPMDYMNIVGPQGGGMQQQMPTAPGGGVSRGGQVSADAITQLLAATKIPEKQKRLNLFWG